MKCIDVSHHQGKIDWNRVARSGVQGVIIRAGYGKGNTDRTFHQNIEGAINAGIPNIGVYWFSYAYNEGMARQEAEYAHRLIYNYKDRLNLGVYFDWEYDSMNYARKYNHYIDKHTVTAMNRAFCEMIQSLGYAAGYYFNEDYKKNWIDINVLACYRKWYARYSSKAKPEGAYIFQYSSTGKVDGINGYVDLDKLLAPLSLVDIAHEVIEGKWGNGSTRKNKLESAGYNYREVQDMVNLLIKQRSENGK